VRVSGGITVRDDGPVRLVFGPQPPTT
jgi:hypothetical protein